VVRRPVFDVSRTHADMCEPNGFVAGTMILAFGTFWTLESLAGADVWPLADWSLVGLVAFYLCGGLVLYMMPPAIRRRQAAPSAPRHCGRISRKPPRGFINSGRKGTALLPTPGRRGASRQVRDIHSSLPPPRVAAIRFRGCRGRMASWDGFQLSEYGTHASMAICAATGRSGKLGTCLSRPGSSAKWNGGCCANTHVGSDGA
jgi:hypothetical protein